MILSTVGRRAFLWAPCSKCRGRASDRSRIGRTRASIPLQSKVLHDCDKLALVLGTEGDGLSAHTIADCDYTVRIPMEHEVDSLNVAAASAVAFWELRTRHREEC